MTEQKTDAPQLGLNALLACPFCGFDSVTVSLVACWAEAQCDTCGARSGLCETEKAAAETWNSRAVTPEMVRRESCLQSLLGYVTTCREANTEDWMDGLRRRINLTLESIGDSDRVEVDKDGLRISRYA